MKAGRLAVLLRLHDIEGDHARHHATHAAQLREQHVGVADPVLETDDCDAALGVLGDQRGHRARTTALDRHQDDIRPGKGGHRIGGKFDRGRRQDVVGAGEVGDAQTKLGNGCRERRPQQQGNVAARQRQASADIAADAAGAGDDDARMANVTHCDASAACRCRARTASTAALSQERSHLARRRGVANQLDQLLLVKQLERRARPFESARPA